MNTSKYLVGGVIVAVVLSLFAVFNTPQDGVNGKDGSTLGAVPTLDGVDNPDTSIGGLKTKYLRQSITATSTKVCRIRNTYATSTVLSVSLAVKTGILGATQVSLSTTTAAQAGFATSTGYLVFEHTIASGAQDYINWLPGLASTTNLRVIGNATSTGENTQTILNPGEYLSWGLASTTAGTVNAAYYTGTCSAVVQEL